MRKKHFVEQERCETVELARQLTNPDQTQWPQEEKFPYQHPHNNDNLKKRADKRQQAINRSYLDEVPLPEGMHNKSSFRCCDNKRYM